MAEAQRTISIRRPVDEVFAYVLDGANGPSWRPGVLDVEVVSGSGVGTVYRQGVKGPGGRRIAADYQITALEPNRRIAFRAIAGPVRPEGEYRFAETAGGTELTFSLRAELSGLKKLVLGRTVQATMESEVGSLDELKRILESVASGVSSS